MASKEPQVSVAEVRSTIVDYFEEKASYRQSLVAKYPWQTAKNGGYAQSLEKVANYVGGLPDDDPTLCALAACPHLYCPWADLFSLPSRGDGAVTSFDIEAVHAGPRGAVMADGEVAGWFASWAANVIAEAKEISEQGQD